MKNEKMKVACTNANGEADVFCCTLNVSQEDYDLGKHYDLAKEQAKEFGYEHPFVCFDEHEQNNLKRAMLETQSESNMADDMNYYLVKLDVQAGAYEKSNSWIVSAPSETLAGSMACFAESHDPSELEWHDLTSVDDMKGEFHYSMAGVTPLTSNEFDVLNGINIGARISMTAYDEDALMNSGNFHGFTNVDTLQLLAGSE